MEALDRTEGSRRGNLQAWAKTLRCRYPSPQGSVYLTDR